MAEGNGKDNTQQRLEDSERMDKLLLRAQVLLQDQIEQNAKATARHEQWIIESQQREKRIDERIEKLVSSIGELIGRMPPESFRG